MNKEAWLEINVLSQLRNKKPDTKVSGFLLPLLEKVANLMRWFPFQDYSDQ
ncbi:hypothetical protein [Flavobacterium sp.]|uniref:hypothetical protein n=1 Tax=Flavobacterium sp. TaxID=239 RepID=UPI00260CAC8F|nr:hypothetical protein [Flavobacterium sp.]